MTVFPYTPEAKEKALRLEICKHERDELIAFNGENPKTTLEASLDVSILAWYGEDAEGNVIGVGGLSPHPEEEGMAIPWMLLGEGVLRKHLFSINALVIQFIDYCFKNLNLYCLCNFVDLRNKPSIKWLSSLGFEFSCNYRVFHDPNVVFDEFYLYKEDWHV